MMGDGGSETVGEGFSWGGFCGGDIEGNKNKSGGRVLLFVDSDIIIICGGNVSCWGGGLIEHVMI